MWPVRSLLRAVTAVWDMGWLATLIFLLNSQYCHDTCHLSSSFPGRLVEKEVGIREITLITLCRAGQSSPACSDAAAMG